MLNIRLLNISVGLCLLPGIGGCGSSAPLDQRHGNPQDQPNSSTQIDPHTETQWVTPVPSIPYKIVEKKEDGSTVIEITSYREFPETRMREKVDAFGKTTFESITEMTRVPQTQTLHVPAGMDVATFLTSKPQVQPGEIDFQSPNSGPSDAVRGTALTPAPASIPAPPPSP